eukprot:COSAG06_NODE_438_length_15766_cov_6.128997_11_plen_451_part_00
MSFGASVAELEAIAPDPRLWYKHGGAAPADATSIRDLGLLPHAILPLLCLLPASIAAVRFAVRGRYDIAAVALGLVLVSQAYHHCRLSGDGHMSLLATVPSTDASCVDWRKLDMLALMAAIAFVAASAVGLADWRIIAIGATAFPAKAVQLVLLTDDTRYHQIVHTLFWWVFIVVINPLFVRYSIDGSLKSLDAALHPDLRKRDPLPRVIMPFLIAAFCFVAPCAGANFIGDPEIYWPSLWGCHAAIGLSMCGILGAELQSVAEAEAKAREAAAPKADTSAPRRAHQRLAPKGDRKPKELSDKCRKRVSSKLTEIAKELAEQNKEANIAVSKVRVTGNAKVTIIDDGKDAMFFGGEAAGKDDVQWAPKYSLSVELDLGVSYGEAYNAPVRPHTVGGQPDKVTKRRANGHCSFQLTDTKSKQDKAHRNTTAAALHRTADSSAHTSAQSVLP